MVFMTLCTVMSIVIFFLYPVSSSRKRLGHC